MTRVKRYERPGKPTLYNEVVLEKAYEYLNDCKAQEDVYEVVEDDEEDSGTKVIRRYGASGKVSMPNAGGLAIHLQVNKTTLYEWAKTHDDFAYFMDLMNAVREDRLHEGGLSGRYSSSITAIMLGKYGYHKTVDNLSSDGSMSSNHMAPLSTEQLEAIANAEIAKDASANDNS